MSKGLKSGHMDTNWLRRVLEVNEIGSTGNRSWNLWMMGMSKQPLDFGAHVEMHFLTVRFLYTRTPRCTFSGFSHHNGYITMFRTANAPVMSSNLVIGRPWTPRAMHCITNQPV